MRLLFFLCISALALAGCKTTAEQSPVPETSEVQMEVQMADGIHGTVKYINLEGGFYGIQGDDGESYYPINLDEEYKEDGLKIIFKMKSRTDVFTTAMWGKTVEITKISEKKK